MDVERGGTVGVGVKGSEVEGCGGGGGGTQLGCGGWRGKRAVCNSIGYIR